MNPFDLPPDRLCNLVMVWLREHMEEDAWTRFEQQVTTPPPGVAATAAPTDVETNVLAYGAAVQEVSRE